MAEVYGFNSYILFGRESTWGTLATLTNSAKVKSFGVKRNVPYVPRESLGLPTTQGVVQGTKSGSGTIAFETIYEGLECFLAYCLGDETPTGPTDTTVYTWTFTPQTTVFSGGGLSVETVYGDADWGYQWDGGKVNGLTFSQEKDKVLSMEADLTFQGIMLDASPATPTYPTDLPCLESEFTMKIDNVSYTNVSSWNTTIANGLSTDRAQLGTGEILEQFRGDFVGITGSWAGDYTASTYMTGMEAGTSYKLEFIYTSTTKVAGSASTYYTLQFTMPECYILGDTPEASGPGVIPATNNFMAVYNSTAGYAIEVKLLNALSGLPTAS